MAYRETAIRSLVMKATRICKIPPNLPFAKGGTVPLFGKEGEGKFYNDEYATAKP